MKHFVNINFSGHPESKIDPIIRGYSIDKQPVRFHVTPDGVEAFSGDNKLELPHEIAKYNDLKNLIELLRTHSVKIFDNKLKLNKLPTEHLLKAVACAADGGCTADKCAAHGGCAARAGCAAQGCAAHGGCAADAGCAARGCAADAGCGANIPCAADACAGHACGVHACPANINIGPCAVDLPICPIIL